nr:MAG TPA: hypothetical protein [Microviridae sp.]
MAFRHKINRGKSRRSFTRGAVRTNRRNFAGAPMRGGIRL